MYLTDIEKSIERILSTPLGSRVMQPTFGSELYLLIDRRVDDMWKLLFAKYVFEAIEIEKAGLKVEFKNTDEYPVPVELQLKFDEMTK